MKQDVVLAVAGMSCTGCESNVRFALSSLQGVQDARPDHMADTVWVAFDPNVTSLDAIRQGVEDIGYRVES